MDPQPVLEYIPPSRLLPPLIDIRDRTTAAYREWFDRLVADLRVRGKQMPISAYLDGDRPRIIDSETSRQASLIAGLETVPVLIYPQKPDDKDLPLVQLLANAMRQDMTPAEQTAVYLELMRSHGWSQADLCRHVPNLSRPTLCRALKWLREIPEEYRSKIASRMDGMIPPKGAYLVTLFPVEERKELCEKFIKGLMTVELLEDIRKRRNGGKPKAKALKLTFGGVVMTIKGNPVEALRALHAKLSDVLKRLDKEGWGDDFLPGLMR
jgi:hypothetical protein